MLGSVVVAVAPRLQLEESPRGVWGVSALCDDEAVALARLE